MKNYRISYLHNNTSKANARYMGPIAQVSFETKDQAFAWVKENPQFTPIKLLAWCDDIDCFQPIHSFFSVGQKVINMGQAAVVVEIRESGDLVLENDSIGKWIADCNKCQVIR